MKSRAVVFVIASASLGAFTFPALAGGDSTPHRINADYANQPLSFEPNRGQADKQADFLARGPGYNLLMSHGEAVFVMQQAGAKASSDAKPQRISATRVRMKVAGANPSAQAHGLDEQPSKSNYFIGNDPEKWHTNIANYAKVRYGDVYPGIDLIYYGNHHQLEYDFVVEPGADPNAIKLDFEGPAKIDLGRSGALVMHTAGVDLRWHKPVAIRK